MRVSIVLFALLLAAAPAAAGDAGQPRSMAGLTLGKNIKELSNRLRLEGSMPLWNRPYVARADIREVEGYESGYVTFGKCKRKGTILRFKLKYKNDSEDFFNKIKKTLTKRYGKQDQWRGNAFGTLQVWKWSVKGQGKWPDTSIIIMHFSGESEDFTPGNSIRLSFPDWMVEERKCWKAKHQKHEDKPLPAEKSGFQWMLPY
jgi:hypothetical protein